MTQADTTATLPWETLSAVTGANITSWTLDRHNTRVSTCISRSLLEIRFQMCESLPPKSQPTARLWRHLKLFQYKSTPLHSKHNSHTLPHTHHRTRHRGTNTDQGTDRAVDRGRAAHRCDSRLVSTVKMTVKVEGSCDGAREVSN